MKTQTHRTPYVWVLWASIALAGLTAGCSKQDNTDTTKPTVEILEPTPIDTLYFGHREYIRIRFRDDQNLSGYKVNIHYGGDHTHTTGVNTLAEVNFSKEWIGQLDGKTDTTIVLPLDLPVQPNTNDYYEGGLYHLVAETTDGSLNEARAYVTLPIVYSGESPNHTH